MRLADSTMRERVKFAGYLCKHLKKHPAEATKEELRALWKNTGTKTLSKGSGSSTGNTWPGHSRLFQSAPIPVRPKIVPHRDKLARTYQRLRSRELRLAFLLIASSGMRRHELIRLTWDKWTAKRG